MSYLVLVLGVVLALGGAAAVVTSYGIILVERGWAGVIAGTAALSGGIITIALGIILHRLTSLHAALKSAAAGLPLGQESAEEGTGPSGAGELPHYLPKSAMPPEVASAPASGPTASGLRNWPQRQTPRTAHSAGRSMFKPRGTAVPPQPRTREPGAALPPQPVPSLDLADLAGETGAAPYAGSAAGLDSGAAAAESGSIIAQPGVEAEASPAAEALADHLHGGADSAPTPVPHDGEGEMPANPPQYPEMPAAAGEARDQAILQNGEPAQSVPFETIMHGAESGAAAQLAQASSGVADKLLPGAPEEVALQPPPDPSAAAGAGPAAVPSGEELPPVGTFAGAALAIVGRYESEGASFIRYADGSIEARTEHAVFHFNSMDELKRFMESQAQLPKE